MSEIVSGDIGADENQSVSTSTDAAAAWRTHPIDIRISLPFVNARYYFTFVAGRERRREDRRREDRSAYPLITFGNVLFSLGVTTLFVLAAVAALIMQSAIIE